MKSLYEGKEIKNLDPSKLFKATKATLSYMFQSDQPFFGTLLDEDSV
jgi:hypothetical protein